MTTETLDGMRVRANIRHTLIDARRDLLLLKRRIEDNWADGYMTTPMADAYREHIDAAVDSLDNVLKGLAP